MRVARHEVDPPGAEECPDARLDLPPPAPVHARRDRLRQRAGGAGLVQHARVAADGTAALRMREDEVEPELPRPYDRLLDEASRSLGLELDEHEAAVAARVHLLVGGREEDRGRELGGEAQLEWDARVRQLGASLRESLRRELGQRRVAPRIVRRAEHGGDPGALEGGGKRKRFRASGRPVVERRQQVAVRVDHLAAPPACVIGGRARRARARPERPRARARS